jgi:hypothetical protein
MSTQPSTLHPNPSIPSNISMRDMLEDWGCLATLPNQRCIGMGSDNMPGASPVFTWTMLSLIELKEGWHMPRNLISFEFRK